MILALTLAAGLFAAIEPQVESPKRWIILDDSDGVLAAHEYLKQPEPPKGKEWTIESGGHAYPKRREWIIEFQWEAEPQIDPVEVRYFDDLPKFFEQLKKR